MNLRVRNIADDELDTWIAIKNAVTPDWPADRASIEWADRTYPGSIRRLAELDGRAVGVLTAGRIHVLPPDHPDWWLEIAVLPEARRGGVGTALLRDASAAARAAGKRGFHAIASEARPEGFAFLRRFGFTELERSKTVALELRNLPPPEPASPDGITITTLAQRPDFVPGIHAVAERAFPDIPGGEPMAVGDLDEFRARDVDRPGMAPEAFHVALAGDRVVGYASVVVEPGRPTVGLHDMTAVDPDWRGRGIATALKRATIAWAIRAGLETLETGNDEANDRMRALNARLGYRPLPDLVILRGPLLDPLEVAVER